MKSSQQNIHIRFKTGIFRTQSTIQGRAFCKFSSACKHMKKREIQPTFLLMNSTAPIKISY